MLDGPGSGKSRVLTGRIARILDSSRDKNFRILALTFTNTAADEMRNEIFKLVPGMENRLFLGTFHSFCADILRQHGVHIGISPNFAIYSQEADLLAVLNEALEKEKLSQTVNHMGKKALPIIKRLKSRLTLPKDCRKEFTDKFLGKQISATYTEYEKELSRRNALDFDSLIIKTYQLFTKYPSIARRYRTVYPYICIDEFQNMNDAQYALIGALTREQHKNLFVVADDNQIIYRWNGASYKKIVKFRDEYSSDIIQLPVAFRCPPQIVTLANKLIRKNFLRKPEEYSVKPFEPGEGSGKNVVRLLEYRDFEAEASGIAKDIDGQHAKSLDSVIILGRSRYLLQGVEKALKKAELPAAISERKGEFESTPFVWLHSILNLANDRISSAYLESTCGSFAQLTDIAIDPDDVISQAQASNNDYLQHWIKYVEEHKKAKDVQKIIQHVSNCLGEGRDFRSFSNLALNWFRTLMENNSKTNNITGNEFFTHYVEEKSVWKDLMSDSLDDKLTLEAFLQKLQMPSEEPRRKSKTVTLMTIHGAKGKEFRHVYLVGFVDDVLPSFQSKRKGDMSPEMEEERRSCFAAITSTVETLTISYAKEYGKLSKDPSRFLFEMGLLPLK